MSRRSRDHGRRGPSLNPHSRRGTPWDPAWCDPHPNKGVVREQHYNGRWVWDEEVQPTLSELELAISERGRWPEPKSGKIRAKRRKLEACRDWIVHDAGWDEFNWKVFCRTFENQRQTEIQIYTNDWIYYINLIARSVKAKAKREADKAAALEAETH